VTIVAACTAAHAADLGDDYFLRGAVSAPVRWDGFVAGAQIGGSQLNADFTDSTRQLVGNILRNSTLEAEARVSDWDVLGTKTATGASYGGFVGYNWQFDDIVIGVDASYNHLSSASASDGPSSFSLITTLSGGSSDQVTITARSRVALMDYVTARVRAGWAWGQVLPYAFVGAAVGRFDYSTTAKVVVVQNPSSQNPKVFNPPAESSSKTNMFQPGIVAGLGMDWALLPNVFLRAEWEYAAFGELKGIRPTVNTGRVGVAFRF
jgi:opacity protein-like surface antigen